MYASEQRKAIPFHKLSWSDDAQLAQFCEDAWEHRSAEQQRAEQWGELVAAWYEGNQYLALTNVGTTNASHVRLATLDDFGRNRYVFNLFAPHLDQFVAKVAMDPLEPEAVPRSGSLPDLDAARLQTGVCQYYRDLLDLQHIKDELMKIIAMDAIGFTKIIWDPLAGNEFELTPEQVRAYGVQDEILREVQDEGVLRLNTGELRVSNVQLRNLTWGPVGVPWEEAEWVLEAREHTISYVKARWNIKDEDLEPAYNKALFRRYRGYFGANGSIEEPNDDEMVIVYELWCPRSARNPKGRHAVVIGQKCVNRRRNRGLVNPYAHGKVPYIKCACLDVPGRAIGKTVAWDAFDPQAAINMLATQIMEITELCANPRLWIQEGETIDEYELTSRPGGIHRYKSTKPEWEDGVAPSSSIYGIFDRWIRVLQDVFGIHDPSMGKAPAQGRSGRYVLALQDADNSRLAPVLKNVKRWSEDLFRMILCVVRQYVDDYRLIAVRGQDNQWERRAFRGETLLPDNGANSSGPEAFNIVLRSAGQVRSRAAQIELVTMLVQYGFYRPENPEHRRQVMLALELGDASQTLDVEQQHRDMQRRVHESLFRGVWVAPAYYHRHATRLDELRKVMNTPEFEQQPDNIKELFRRYEVETLKLQAIEELERQKIAQQAVMEWQARQQQEARQRAMAMMAQVQASAPIGEQARIGQIFNSPRGAALRGFLEQMPAPKRPTGPQRRVA